MRKITSQINTYSHKKEWKKAEKILLENIRLYPEEYWLYTTLSEIYSEQERFEGAYHYSQKAMELNSEDPLVIYNHAEILLLLGGKKNIKNAIDLLNAIIKTGVKCLAYGQYGEGLKYGKSKYNDSFALLGYAYYDLHQKKIANKYFKKHLSLRQRGIHSSFIKKKIEKIYKETKYFSTD